MRDFSERIKVLIDISRDVDGFTGDDADQFSEQFDLGGLYRYVRIESPALNASATVGLQRQSKKRDIGDADSLTEVPVPIEFQKSDNTTAIWARSAQTTAFSANVVDAGGIQFGRIKVSANQAADREFYVQGFN